MALVDVVRTATTRVGSAFDDLVLARIAPTVVAPAAPEQAPRVPVHETGYVRIPTAGALSGFTVPDFSDDAPDLLWPASVKTYSRMERSDSQVASVLRAVTLPVMRTDWALEPDGAEDEVTRLVAEDLGLPVRGWDPDQLGPRRGQDRFSFSAHLEQALKCLPQGHQFFEQLYRIEAATGYARLRKLALRPPATITAINVDTDGGLTSIEQAAPSGVRTSDGKPPKIVIPVRHLVAYVYRGGPGNWVGESILRAGYKDWLLKDDLLRVDTEGIHRNSMGVPQYTASEGGGQAEIDAGRRLAQAYRAANAGGAALPNGATLELKGVSGKLREALPRIEYHDRQLARAVLAHFLNLNAQGGSYALAEVQANTFTQSLQTVAQSIADVINAHVVEDLVDANFGPDARAPRVVFADIGSQQMATAAAISLLVDKGILTADDGLESATRRTYRLPERVGGVRVPPAPASEQDPAPSPGGD